MYESEMRREAICRTKNCNEHITWNSDKATCPTCLKADKNSFTEKGITKLGTGKTLSKILNKRLSLD